MEPPMLISTIQRDLISFIEHDQEDLAGLVEFWYRENSDELSAALAAQPGLNLIVNVSSFTRFEELARKAFLIADTIVVRDTRKWMNKGEAAFRSLPIPTGEYRPGYYDKILEQLKSLRPPPLTLIYKPPLEWSSTTKHLNNGLTVAYAAYMDSNGYNGIPQNFIDWINGSGREYLETGRVVYAPFIPSFEMELEFLKHGVNVPDYFKATPLYSEKFDWLTEGKIDALLKINIPYFEGLDLKTISKIKDDNRPEFESFSRSMINSISGIKGAVGSEDFAKEVRYVQRNVIDAGIADIDTTVRRISSMNTLRNLGITLGLIGLDAGVFLGLPVSAIATGFGAAAAAMVASRVAQIKERGDLKEKSPYFLWKLRNLRR